MAVSFFLLVCTGFIREGKAGGGEEGGEGERAVPANAGPGFCRSAVQKNPGRLYSAPQHSSGSA